MSSQSSDLFSDGSRLALARGIKKMSQAELGAKIGKTKLTIGRWERGGSPIPDMAWLPLSEILEIRPEWLRDGQGEMSFSNLKKSFREKENIIKERLKQEKEALEIACATGIDSIIYDSKSKYYKSLSDLQSMGDLYQSLIEWVQARPDKLELENLDFDRVYQIRYNNLERAKKEIIPLVTHQTTKSTRRLLERILNDDISDLMEMLDELSDDQIANVSTFIRELTRQP